MEEARAKMIAKRFGGNKSGASTGGSGSARRNVKAVHKSSGGGKFEDLALLLLYLLTIIRDPPVDKPNSIFLPIFKFLQMRKN